MAGACKGILKRRFISKMESTREVHRAPSLVGHINLMRKVHISSRKPLMIRQQDPLRARLPHHRYLRAYLLSSHLRSTSEDIRSREASTKLTSCKSNLSFRPLNSSNSFKRLIRLSTRRRCARTGSKSASAGTETNASLPMEKTS